MGSTIDACDKILARNDRARNDTRASAPPRRYKYTLLIVSLLAATAGIQISGILDPLSMAMRSYIVLYSYFDSLVKLILRGASSLPVIGSISSSALDLLKDMVLDLNDMAFRWHGAVLLIFVTVLLMSLRVRRFWCRNLCPLGACHSIASRFPLLVRTVNPERCTRCRACEQQCRMGAIHGDGMLTYESECIRCMDCLTSCPQGAISFKFSLPWKGTRMQQADARKSVGFTRRDLLASLAVSAAAIPLIKANADAANASTSLIRPPGAAEEERFLSLCIRCGMCMKVCPTNGLQPALLESGVEGIFTPRLIPRIGWCEKNCNLCSQVCPTGAIRTVDLEERETLIIGTAVILRDLCIPWSEDRDCIVCEEMCPTATKSIRFTEKMITRNDGSRGIVKLPYVLEDICIGCGICENKCPVRGSGAIKVRRWKRGRSGNTDKVSTPRPPISS